MDILLESIGYLGLLLCDEPIETMKLLKPELEGSRPAREEGLPGTVHCLLLHQ